MNDMKSKLVICGSSTCNLGNRSGTSFRCLALTSYLSSLSSVAARLYDHFYVKGVLRVSTFFPTSFSNFFWFCRPPCRGKKSLKRRIFTLFRDRERKKLVFYWKRALCCSGFKICSPGFLMHIVANANNIFYTRFGTKYVGMLFKISKTEKYISSDVLYWSIRKRTWLSQIYLSFSLQSSDRGRGVQNRWLILFPS